MDALRQVDQWPVRNVEVGVVAADGSMWGATPGGRHFEWASVTKVATALTILVAAEEGIIDLDEAAGPPGATVRHLLAHASGLPPEVGPPMTEPARRRIYSSYGFEVLADHVAERAEMPFGQYFRDCLAPADVMPDLYGSAGWGARGTIRDIVNLARELLSPSLIGSETLAEATAVQFPGLSGVLPGFGRQDPNDWGLGLEIRDAKSPHWTGSGNSPRTFGHFGRAGTFLWVDPEAGVACVCLTDRPFDEWAREAWPRLSDAVLEEAARS